MARGDEALAAEHGAKRAAAVQRRCDAGAVVDHAVLGEEQGELVVQSVIDAVGVAVDEIDDLVLVREPLHAALEIGMRRARAEVGEAIFHERDPAPGPVEELLLVGDDVGDALGVAAQAAVGLLEGGPVLVPELREHVVLGLADLVAVEIRRARVQVVPLVAQQSARVLLGERDVDRLVALDELGQREARPSLHEQHHLQHPSGRPSTIWSRYSDMPSAATPLHE